MDRASKKMFIIRLAKGKYLNALVSLFGLERKKKETDKTLRKRALTFLEKMDGYDWIPVLSRKFI